MRTATLAMALFLVSTAFVAAPATAYSEDYLCVGQDNGPDDAAEVCLTQDDGEDDTAGPECEEEGRYDRANAVEVDIEQQDYDIGADAEGQESCYKSCFFGSCFSSEEQSIEVSGYFQDETNFDTTEFEISWTENEDGCDTTAEIDSDQAGVEEEFSLAEQAGDGCPLGPPPNPGWGTLPPPPAP